MKALFYGGAISSLAGLALGMGMAPPPEQPPTGPDAQPVTQLAASDQMQGSAYGPPPDEYAYVVNAAYSPGPVYDLRPETAVEVEPVADVAYDAPPAEAALADAGDDAGPATPQEVAAAGDTTPAPQPARSRTGPRAYASIEAVLAAVDQGQQPAPSL